MKLNNQENRPNRGSLVPTIIVITSVVIIIGVVILFFILFSKSHQKLIITKAPLTNIQNGQPNNNNSDSISVNTATKTQPTPKNTVSGVAGLVSISPTCPVEKVPPEPNCLPKPYRTSIKVTKPDDSSFLIETSSDNNGHYQADLEPGKYEITASSGAAYPKCEPVMTEVNLNILTRLDISCDSGIR